MEEIWQSETSLTVSTSSADILQEGKINDITWKIDKDYKLTVEGAGDYISGGNPPWAGNTLVKSAVVSITGITSTRNMFYGCQNLESIDLTGLDTSKVTDMSGMFAVSNNLTYGEGSHISYSRLKSLDLSGFDTRNVTNMSGMFRGCDKLAHLDMRNFHTEKVTDMSGMFEYCAQLQELDLSSFDTSQVRDMSNMFRAAGDYLNMVGGDTTCTVTLGETFHTGNVTDMSGMFDECWYWQELDVSGFDTSGVTNMEKMFRQCRWMKNLDVSSFNTGNVMNMRSMFAECTSLRSLDVSRFDTAKVSSMEGMFSGCAGLTSLDVSRFDTAKVSSMEGTFSGCVGLTSLDVSRFDTAKVSSMKEMFSACSKLESLTVSSFDTADVTDMQNMFSGCGSLTALDVSNFDLGGLISNYTYGWLDGCSQLTYLCTPKNCAVNILLPTDTGKWYRKDGTECTALPVGLSYSIVLYKNGCPEEGGEQIVFVSGITADNKIYDGEPYRYKGDAVVSDAAGSELTEVTLTASYSGTLTDGSAYEESAQAPSQAGDYTLTLEASGKDGEKYRKTAYNFRISRREVTVTAPSISVETGDALPDLSAWKCEVAGLVGEDALSTEPSLKYGVETDKILMDKAGSYAIVPYGAAIAGSVAGNYRIRYIEGRLRIGQPTEDEKPVASGKINSISWQIDKAGKLTIKGSGEYRQSSTAYEIIELPWTAAGVRDLVVSAEVKLSNIRNVGCMFAGCGNLRSVDLSGLDTGKVEDMSNMFYGCHSLESVDLSGFNTGKVTSMHGMFSDCRSLEKLELGSLDVGNVYDMGSMFYGCRKLRSLDLSGFKTSIYLFSMGSMFSGCSSLDDIDLSGFDTSHVTKMSSMFSDCGSLTGLDLRSLDMSQVAGADGDNMFRNCNSLSYIYTPKNCAATVLLPTSAPADKWSSQDGMVYTSLPQGQAESLLIYKNGYLESGSGELKQIVTLSGIDVRSKVYDGEPASFIGTAAVTDADGNIISDLALTYIYSGVLADGTPYAETAQAPSQAGSYALSVRAADDAADRFIIRRSTYSFGVSRREVVITAPTVMIELGAQLPALSDLQYETAGLLDGDELTVKPSLRYSQDTVSTVQTGKCQIIPYGADAGNNYSIRYVSGLLMIGDYGDVLPTDIPSDGVIPDGLWIAGIAEAGYGYTGKALKPVVRVYDHKTRLKEKTDYTIAYKNNTKAYAADPADQVFDAKKAPTITVTGKGNYAGKEIQTFKILPLDLGIDKDMAGNNIFAADDMTIACNNKAQKPLPVLMWNDKKLKNKTDYTIAYYDGKGGKPLESVKDAGSYWIEFTGKGNFTGTRRISLTVTGSLKLMSKMSVAKIPNQPYTGSALTPTLTVKDGRTLLSANEHYTVSYSRHTKVGTAYAVITGNPAKGYSGTKRVSFKITGTPMSKVKVAGLADRIFVYGGLEHKPALTITVNVGGAEETLTEGRDYTAVWQKNCDAGTAAVTFTGRGGYTGTLKKSFKIKPYELRLIQRAGLRRCWKRHR